MKKGYTPGTKAPMSAQYEIVGPRGGHTGKEIQSTKGNPLPPTPKSGMLYRPVDPVKNGNGKP